MLKSVRHPAVLFLAVLIGSWAHCTKPGGPFVTITINGIPPETTLLSSMVTFGDSSQPGTAAPMPTGTSMAPLTIELPAGSRGTLVVSTQAMFDSSCTLATGSTTVELSDDAPYQASLTLVDAPLLNCTGLATAKLTLYKIETGNASGTVVSEPAGIDCGAGCTQQLASYRPGTVVTLTARPAPGSFVTWSEPSCVPYHVCKVTMSQALSLTAAFAPCSKGLWCNEGSPTVTSDLSAVWGVSASAMYAVGDGGTILLGNGMQWSPMQSGVTAPLRTVGGDKASQAVYAGGDNGTLLQLSGMQSWASAAFPMLSGKQITGIVGESYTPFLQPPNVQISLCTAQGDLFLKPGGGSWVASTDSALSGQVLHGVGAGNAGGNGRETTVVGDAGFILRWTTNFLGTRSTAVNTISPVATPVLNGIWTGTNLSVAVGNNGTIITRATKDYGNTGSKTWKVIPSPVTTRLTAVWGGDDANIWIVGDGGVILKYDGNVSVTKLTNVPVVDLTGVWAADNNQATVRAVGKRGVILRYQP